MPLGADPPCTLGRVNADDDWTVVLQEPWPADATDRVTSWRESYDPERRIADEDIRIDTIRTADGRGSLRILVRRERT